MASEPSVPEPRPSPGAKQQVAPQVARPFFGLLDNVRSVWNVGSMFRTADATGINGLFLCGVTATPPRSDMEKTALGATLTVPWDYWENAVEAITHLQQNGVRVIALEQTDHAEPYDDFQYPFPLCCVVGHEVRGVSPAVLAQVDATVEIPMCGTKDSLNVAVSFGILTYEIRKQWLRQPESAPFASRSLFRDIASSPNRGGST